MLFECTHQSVQWNLEALSITGTSTSDNQRSWQWHISSARSITATPGHQNCSPPNSNTWAKSSVMCLRLSSLPTWTGAIALSWAGHGKIPEVWKNPRHKDTQHHSQPTRLNKTPTWCNKMQILLLQTFSTCFGHHAPIIRGIKYWHGSHRYR